MERAYGGGVWMHIPSVWALKSLIPQQVLGNLIACIRWRRPMGDAGGDQRCGCALDKSLPLPRPPSRHSSSVLSGCSFLLSDRGKSVWNSDEAVLADAAAPPASSLWFESLCLFASGPGLRRRNVNADSDVLLISG